MARMPDESAGSKHRGGASTTDLALPPAAVDEAVREADEKKWTPAKIGLWVAIALLGGVAWFMVAIVRGETVTRRGPSDVSWSGLIQGEFGRVTLVLTTKGLTGTLQSLRNYASYKVEPIGGGLQAIACIDSSQYPPD